MRDEDVGTGMLVLTWASWIWPSLLTLAFLLRERMAGRRIAFFVLGILICYGCLCITGTITTRWQYDVTKSLSASDQIAVIWVKAGLAAQVISFLAAIPFLFWLRRELCKGSVAAEPIQTRQN